MATAPITPRASQALGPPREAGSPEAPPTHVRARAPCASWDWPHRRPIPGKLGSGTCPGEDGKGRVRAELELGGPRRGCRVSWTTSDQRGACGSFQFPAQRTQGGHWLPRTRRVRLCVALLRTEEAAPAWHPRTPPGCTRPRHARPPRRSTPQTPPPSVHGPEDGLMLSWRRLNRGSAFLWLL